MPRNARADNGMPAALTCSDVRAREWNFVEGVLPIPERTAVQAHLDGCESCRREMTLCRSASSALLSASSQVPAAGDLRTDFYARLAAQQRPARRYGRPLALSAVAAGIVALALIRPGLQRPIVPPAHPGSTSGPLAAAHPPPTIAPAVQARLSEETLLRLSIAGLSEVQADSRLSGGDPRSIVQARHHRTLHRHVQHRLVAGVDRRLWIGRPVVTSSTESARNYSYYIPDVAKADSAELAKKTADLPAQQKDVQANAFDARLRERMWKPGLVVTAGVSADAGVSLEVTDQVRGFSNTTHIASDVEVQGESSTIHIAADGN